VQEGVAPASQDVSQTGRRICTLSDFSFPQQSTSNPDMMDVDEVRLSNVLVSPGTNRVVHSAQVSRSPPLMPRAYTNLFSLLFVLVILTLPPRHADVFFFSFYHPSTAEAQQQGGNSRRRWHCSGADGTREQKTSFLLIIFSFSHLLSLFPSAEKHKKIKKRKGKGKSCG
jgi:hypothetical protein